MQWIKNRTLVTLEKITFKATVHFIMDNIR